MAKCEECGITPGADLDAAGCMFQAYDRLCGAADRFHAGTGDRRVDEIRAREAERLARDVLAQSPKVQRQVFDALPGHQGTAVRVEDIACETGLDWSLVCETLDKLRYPYRLATQAGGWWKKAPFAVFPDPDPSPTEAHSSDSETSA